MVLNFAYKCILLTHLLLNQFAIIQSNPTILTSWKLINGKRNNYDKLSTILRYFQNIIIVFMISLCYKIFLQII